MSRKHRIVPRIPNLPGPIFDASSVEQFLIAYGDDRNPLPETVKVLDEIVTDYIIESCHEAASVAHHARRAKIKLDDFKFMLRRDTTKLGRVSEMLDKEKELKNSRRAFDTDEGAVAKNEADPTAEGGGKAVKAKSDAGRSRKGGDGGEDEGERKKKKRKKNKETGDEGRSVRSG